MPDFSPKNNLYVAAFYPLRQSTRPSSCRPKRQLLCSCRSQTFRYLRDTTVRYLRDTIVLNTATTIVTFLIVFLIQNTQNRDARAIHLKLDEIIHSLKNARNEMIQIEQLSDTDLENISKNFEKIRAECERRTEKNRVHASK